MDFFIIQKRKRKNMNYEKFFKKQEEEDIKELIDGAHNEILKKLLMCGIEDKEEEFLGTLKNKNYHLYLLSEDFSFHKSYELDGSGDSINLDEYEQYNCVLNAGIRNLSDKYMSLLIDNITQKDIEKARNKYPNNFTTDLIADCIVFGRYEVLNKLKEKNLINDNAILQTIFVYKSYELDKYIYPEVKEDAENIHQVIKTIRVSNYVTKNRNFLAEGEIDNVNYEKIPLSGDDSFLFQKTGSAYIRFATAFINNLRKCNMMGYEKKHELYQDTMTLLRTELKIHQPKNLIDSIGQYDREYEQIKNILKIFVINGVLDFDSNLTREDLPILKKDTNIKDLCKFTKEEEESICKSKFEKMKVYLEQEVPKDKVFKKIKI